MKYLNPLDAGLMEYNLPLSGLEFPPKGWEVLRAWGTGYALRKDRLRVIVDCSQKEDNEFWIHISCSTKNATPTHKEMVEVKEAFLGDRYAYAVYPPKSEYVNIHIFCLHLWSRVREDKVLPEFSADIGFKSI